MKHIFIHGGPGLNSNPERHLLKLTTKGDQLLFWDEPSALRDKNYVVDKAYANWLTSLARFIERNAREEKVTLIAHSFGAFAVNDLLPRIQEYVSSLILIAPIFDLMNLDQNILDLAIKLKLQSGDVKAMIALKEMKASMNVDFDEKRFQALAAALGDDEVLPNYWHNQKASADYNQYFVEKSFNIDLYSFKAVRESVNHNVVANSFDGPVKICYGGLDPVAKLDQDYTLLNSLYPNHKMLISKESGHYPHMEEKSLFTDWLSGKEVALNKSVNRV